MSKLKTEIIQALDDFFGQAVGYKICKPSKISDRWVDIMFYILKILSLLTCL